jgi:lipoprotein NlpI
MGYFVAQNDVNRDQAKALLDEAARQSDTTVWPYPIINHLLGEIDEPALMASGTQGDRMTEVRCFLGLKALQEGKNDVARVHFRWVTENGNASYLQYSISLIELDRLEK